MDGATLSENIHGRPEIGVREYQTLGQIDILSRRKTQREENQGFFNETEHL